MIEMLSKFDCAVHKTPIGQLDNWRKLVKLNATDYKNGHNTILYIKIKLSFNFYFFQFSTIILKCVAQMLLRDTLVTKQTNGSLTLFLINCNFGSDLMFFAPNNKVSLNINASIVIANSSFHSQDTLMCSTMEGEIPGCVRHSHLQCNRLWSLYWKKITEINGSITDDKSVCYFYFWLFLRNNTKDISRPWFSCQKLHVALYA